MPCSSPVRGVLYSGPDGRRRLSFNRSVLGKAVSVPCSSCLLCKLERARQWAVRIMHEAKMHSENSFITLTYDDAHLPQGCEKCAPGVAGSLCVCEVQKFFKRLRERLPCPIRFFLCGEYGEKLGRPHYHAIVFGWSFPDKVLYSRSGELSLFTSPLLSAAWGNGFASVGAVSFDSALYVANYATKKISTNREQESKRLAGRRAEFLCMSRGGRRKGAHGIGSSWMMKYADDVYPSDEVIVRGRSCRPPRYYDQVAEKAGVSAEVLARVKAKREDQACKLEEFLLASGDVVRVAPGNNARRLRDFDAVARAKLALKRRNLGD